MKGALCVSQRVIGITLDIITSLLGQGREGEGTPIANVSAARALDRNQFVNS